MAQDNKFQQEVKALAEPRPRLAYGAGPVFCSANSGSGQGRSIKPVISRRFSLDEGGKATELLAARSAVGKIVVMVD
jgi:hypothetical protein